MGVAGERWVAGVQIKNEPHPYFTRDEADLLCTQNITLMEVLTHSERLTRYAPQSQIAIVPIVLCKCSRATPNLLHSTQSWSCSSDACRH